MVSLISVVDWITPIHYFGVYGKGCWTVMKIINVKVESKSSVIPMKLPKSGKITNFKRNVKAWIIETARINIESLSQTNED